MAVLLVAPRPVTAQWFNQDPPDRTQYVWHVWVDPMFGDDARALADNPPNGSVLPLGIHPDGGDGLSGPDPRPIAGVLQHAPFAFRTLQNAMTYARQFVPAGNGGNPWSRVVSFPRDPPPPLAAGCPDLVPGIARSDGLLESAIRFNCERFDAQTGASISNVQTFLGIRTPYAPPEGAGRAGVQAGQAVAPSRKPTRAEMEAFIRAASRRN